MKVRYSIRAKVIRNLRDAAIMRMDYSAVKRYQDRLDAELRECKIKAGFEL